MPCLSRLVGVVACAAALAAATSPESESSLNVTDSLQDLTLPDVDSMLSEASDTVSKLADTAEKMQEAINNTQEKQQARLKRERQTYSLRLAEQDEQNQRLSAQIVEAKREIESLEAKNAELTSSATNLKGTNEALRTTFMAIYPRFTAARKFLDIAINASDLPKVGKELKVLEEPIPEPSLENFLKQLSKTDIPTALLEVSGKQTSTRQSVTLDMKRRARQVAEDTAQDIVSELSQHLTSIQRAQQEGDDQLRANFLAQFEVAQLKTEQLEAEIHSLTEQKESLLAKQKDLNVAKTALLATNEELLSRMEGISQFAQKSNEFLQKKVKESRDVLADTEVLAA